MAGKLDDTLTLGEVAETPKTLPLAESLEKAISPEEVQVYSELTNKYLLETPNLHPSIKVTALTLLKTLSHLSKNKEFLEAQAKALPWESHREIYYQVPFLPELAKTSDLLDWYQNEAVYLTKFKFKKGDFTPLKMMIYFYESLAFQVGTNKKQLTPYLELAEDVFRIIVGHFNNLNKACRAQDNSHPWYSPAHEKDYKAVAHLWKTTVDVTTVRHMSRLPVHFRRPLNKLPLDWSELLKINHHSKITMLNVRYPLSCLDSPFRETRSYSAFLLHLVCEERPNFLKSLAHTRVSRSFLNRLRMAFKLKLAYPQFPDELPERFQREMFLLLIEQGINSLAKEHNIKEKGQDKLSEKFREFDEQVQTKEKIEITGPEVEVIEVQAPKKTPVVTPEIKVEQEKKPEVPPEEPEDEGVETDFPDITDDGEYGMGIQTMPYVFTFDYDDHPEEVPIEHLPNIKWENIEWSDIQAKGTHVYQGLTRLFINKLETVETYRYALQSMEDIEKIKPVQNYFCFLVKEGNNDKARYYVVVKEDEQKHGKSKVWIRLRLSPRFMKKIDKAYFVIFPKPKFHFLAIPR
ncbi:hypothetical protein WDW89_15740 [Deltaproteobacteria bacterium TL4]